MHDVDLAYLAGVVDADGYVTATLSFRKGRAYCGAQIGITGSRREPHDLAAELFGGRVSQHQPRTGRMQYHWQRGGERAVGPIAALLPFLRIKVVQAELVLDLQEQVSEATAFRLAVGDPYPHMPAGYDPTPSLISAVRDIRALHARTQAHLTRAAGRELDGRVWDQYPEPRPAVAA